MRPRSTNRAVVRDASFAGVAQSSHKPGNEDAAKKRDVLIAMPFYKTPELVSLLGRRLTRLADELKAENARVLFIDDSPDNRECSDAIEHAVRELRGRIRCDLIKNKSNMGIFGSVSQALSIARESRSDVLLLNSDATLSAGTVGELRSVAYTDPMIGFVSPRSNEAKLSTLNLFELPSVPSIPEIRKLSESGGEDRFFDAIDEYQRTFDRSKRFLKRYQYAPTVDGFCVYIKNTIISSFDFFDNIYGTDYNEQRDLDDLIARASRHGYRAALANHAFAFHIGEQSFKNIDVSRRLEDSTNADILNARYPEYLPLIKGYLHSSIYKSEAFLAALIKYPIELLIDATPVGRGHNGTMFLIKKLCEGIAARADGQVNVTIMGQREGLAHHGLDRLENVKIVTPFDNKSYGIALRIGQPFDISETARLSNLAPINIYFMLDTIALDCSHLQSTQLKQLWEDACYFADGIIFNSEFTKQQFNRRFEFGPLTKQVVSYHSLKPSDYSRETSGEMCIGGDHILIVGNHFPHKFVEETYKRLRSQNPKECFWLLGGSDMAISRPGDRLLVSGSISNDEMERCYNSAKAVVFPSHYEGFGFPILDALAHKRPIFVRNTVINREIKSVCRSRNIHLYDREAEISAALNIGVDWIDEDLSTNHDWLDSCSEILEFLFDIYSGYQLDQSCKRMEGLTQSCAAYQLDQSYEKIEDLTRTHEDLTRTHAAYQLDQRRIIEDLIRLHNTKVDKANALTARALRASLCLNRAKRSFFWMWDRKKRKYASRVKEIKALLRES